MKWNALDRNEYVCVRSPDIADAAFYTIYVFITTFTIEMARQFLIWIILSYCTGLIFKSIISLKIIGMSSGAFHSVPQDMLLERRAYLTLEQQLNVWKEIGDCTISNRENWFLVNCGKKRKAWSTIDCIINRQRWLFVAFCLVRNCGHHFGSIFLN